MRIFITGASGWIGSALTPELLQAGHEVVGLARSDASAAAIESAGATAVRGTLSDLDVLRENASAADAVAHLAFIHDSADFDDVVATDARVVETLASALEGSGKALALASGSAVKPGEVATERDVSAIAGPWGARLKASYEALKTPGVRASFVGLPRSVHGDGDRHGFIPMLVNAARTSGVSGYTGDGSNRWPAGHVTDAARLFRLALEDAPAGSVLHAVGDEGVAMGEIAAVIGRHLELPTGQVEPESFGPIGAIFAVDQPASSKLTQELLGWEPTGPGLIEDIEAGHYFA